MRNKKLIFISVPILICTILLGLFIYNKSNDRDDTLKDNTTISENRYEDLNRGYSISKKVISNAKTYSGTLVALSLIQDKDLEKYPLYSGEDFRNTTVKLKSLVGSYTSTKDIANAMGYDYDKILQLNSENKPLTRSEKSLTYTYNIEYYYNIDNDTVEAVLESKDENGTTKYTIFDFDSTGNLLVPSWFGGN